MLTKESAPARRQPPEARTTESLEAAVIEQSVAHPAHPSPVDEETRTRILRGIALYRERGHAIEWVWPNVYLVPSCSGSESYKVDLTLGYCSCPDHRP